MKRTLATVEFLLVFPASLFMTALFMRNVQPEQYEPAHTARSLVEWFSAHTLLGMDVALVAMPFVAFVLGCAVTLRSWRRETEFRQAMLKTLAAVRLNLATLVIALVTLVAGGILAIVVLHVITD